MARFFSLGLLLVFSSACGTEVGVSPTDVGAAYGVSDDDQISVVEVGAPGTWSQVIALNDEGEAVGNYRWKFNFEHGFIWDPDAGFEEVDPLPGHNRVLVGDVNVAGTVAATSIDQIDDRVSGEWKGMVWSRTDGPTAISPDAVSADGINDSGQVVGRTRRGTIYRWSPDSGLTDIGKPDSWGGANAHDINNAGQILLSGWGGDGISTAVWEDGDGFTVIDDPDAVSVSGFRIGETGTVAGTLLTPDRRAVAFYWTEDSGVVRLDGLLGAGDGWSAAYGVGPNNEIVGYADPGADAYVWSEELGRIDLPRLDACCNAHAYAINGVGQVGGTAWTADGDGRAVVWTVPELLPSPSELIEALKLDVDRLRQEGALTRQEATRLTKRLDNAITALEAENLRRAVNQLNAFVKMVNALVQSGGLGPEDGSELVQAARQIIDDLESG